MADEWFEFANPDHFWMQWRHAILLQQLKWTRQTFRNALEIGCGHGVVRELVERDLGFPVDGCDLNQHALEMAKNGKAAFLFQYLRSESGDAPSLRSCSPYGCYRARGR